MAQDATFIKGNPIWVDYVPAGALTAGAIIITGNGCVVLHSAGVTGAEMGVAAGNGIYEVTLGATLSENVHVDFNNTTKKMVAAGAGDAYFGRICPGNGGADGNKRRVLHLAKTSDAT